jgi:hypothetical protein
MSRKATVLYMRDTAQVVGAFTRNADPNGPVDVADIAGPGLGYWVPSFPASVPIPAEALAAAVVDVDALRDLFVNPGGYFVDASKGANVLVPAAKVLNVTGLTLTVAGDLTITTDLLQQTSKPPAYVALLELNGVTRPPATGTADPVQAGTTTRPLTVRFKVGSLEQKAYHVLIFATQQGAYVTSATPT